jgi:hypothetical protein
VYPSRERPADMRLQTLDALNFVDLLWQAPQVIKLRRSRATSFLFLTGRDGKWS